MRVAGGRTEAHRPRRACCRSCRRTQVLAWARTYPRRPDPVETLGSALVVAAASGRQPSAATQRRWRRHLTAGATVDIDLAELAVRLGLAPNLSRNAPLMRTLSRLCLYNAAAWNPEPDPDTTGHLLIVDHHPPPTSHHPPNRTLASRPGGRTPTSTGHQPDRST